MRVSVIVFALLLPFWASAQKTSRADKALIKNLQEHIQYLASDALEGRRAAVSYTHLRAHETG
jgi:hypothetical protein